MCCPGGVAEAGGSSVSRPKWRRHGRRRWPETARGQVLGRGPGPRPDRQGGKSFTWRFTTRNDRNSAELLGYLRTYLGTVVRLTRFNYRPGEK